MTGVLGTFPRPIEFSAFRVGYDSRGHRSVTIRKNSTPLCRCRYLRRGSMTATGRNCRPMRVPRNAFHRCARRTCAAPVHSALEPSEVPLIEAIAPQRGLALTGMLHVDSGQPRVGNIRSAMTTPLIDIGLATRHLATRYVPLFQRQRAGVGIG